LKHKAISAILVIFLFFINPVYPVEPDTKLKKASFRPQWAPQAQFAGYYVALKKGFYKQAGIDLEIRSGGPRISGLYNVAAGRDTFATEWLTSGIALASKGAPIVNIAQIIQKSGLMLICLKKSGINNPQDMNEKKVGVWPSFFSIPPSILFQQQKVTPKLVTQLFSIDELLQQKIDVASAMIYNEYHVALESGLKPEQLNTFLFEDYGLNFPEDGIYVHKETLTKDPELCRNFINASIDGWLYSFEHPEEAVSIIMEAAEEAKTGTTRRHQETMLQEIQKLMLYRGGESKIGELDQESFNFIHKILAERKILKKKVEYEDFYKPVKTEK